MSKEFKDLDNQELQDELNEAMEQAITKTQAAKGEVTALVLMNLHNIFDMVMEGATTVDICQRLGIQTRTFNKIKQNNAQLQAVMEQAEIAKTDKVKQSLFQMTQMRSVKTQKVLSNGKIVEYDKIIEPDAALIKFFLLNKAADEFKERQEVTVTKREFIIDIIEDGNMVEDVNFTVVEEDKK